MNQCRRAQNKVASCIELRSIGTIIHDTKFLWGHSTRNVTRMHGLVRDNLKTYLFSYFWQVRDSNISPHLGSQMNKMPGFVPCSKRLIHIYHIETK